MTREHRRSAGQGTPGSPAQAGASVGKRTLTEGIAFDGPQRPGTGGGAAGQDGVPTPDGSAAGGGRPMPTDVRAKMERALGADFAGVRIHEGGEAQAAGALAYTQGEQIHFAPGQYDPRSSRGQELLGHELTHVVQQAQGRVAATAQAKGVALNDDASLEREADEIGARAARGEAPALPSAPAPRGGPAGGGVMQRVRGLTEGTHVEVRDGDVPWYGQIVAVQGTDYSVRIGGTDTVKTVPSDQVNVHPSSPVAQVVREIQQGAMTVPQAGAVQSSVQEWTIRTRSTHDTLGTLRFMMICKALSTNQRIAGLLDKHDDRTVKEIVASLTGTLGGRQIIQAWSDPAQDIAARGEAWDIFVNGVDALSGSQGSLDQYFSNCLAHDKGYGQTHEATQSYLFLGSDQSQTGGGESFDSVLNIALAESTNSNIWVGGHKGSGKIRDQLARGFETEKLPTIPQKRQEQQMWSALLTALINAHSPGKPDWAYAVVIRENEDALFAKISEIVPGQLDKARLGEALELMGV